MWRDEAYLLDMLLAAQKVQRFIEDVTWDRFQQDDLLQSAVMHQVQIIGEAARRVSPGYKESHPEIPWARIVGMRHRLVHDYFQIDLERVWDVIKRDIPALIPLIQPLIPPEEPEK